jgi:CDP-diacylglycerol pyrophosphatase
MISSNFDELTKALATSTSRRQTIRVLFTSILGGALGFGGIGTAQAAGWDLRAESAVPCGSGCGNTSDTDFFWLKVQDCEKTPKNCTAVDTTNHNWVLAKEPVSQTSGNNNYTLIAGQRITGIECPTIWQHTNPDYWAFALQAAKNNLGSKLNTLGMAINAPPPYRESCQLHIHVSCIDNKVQSALQQDDKNIPTDPKNWKTHTLSLGNSQSNLRTYRVLRLNALSYNNKNLFQILKDMVGEKNMQNQTLVVAARNLQGGGFYILNSESGLKGAPGMPGGTGAGEKMLLNEKC